MPNYVYRGTDCPHEFEVYQSFSDDPLTECSECGKPVRRVFQPTGLVFKGSGWYVTDSRKKDSGSNGSHGKSSSSTDRADKTADVSVPAAKSESTKAAEPAVASSTGAAKD